MGQGDITSFFEENYKSRPHGFTRKEIEDGIGRKVKYTSLVSMVKYGELRKEECTSEENGRKGGRKCYRYVYVPNNSCSVSNVRRNRTQ